MDKVKIETLLTAIRTGSFSKASEELSCTQSAVTQAMNALEKELGLKILMRNHNGISLTSEGEELLPYFAQADQALETIEREANRIRRGQKKAIRIGSFSSISKVWMSDLLREYQMLHPKVTFSIRIGTNDIQTWLFQDEIDIALTDHLRSKSFRFYPVKDDPYYVVASRELVKKTKKYFTVHELEDYPFIVSTQNALEQLLPSIPKNSIQVDTNDDSTLINMVEQGLGITAIPALSLLELPADLLVIPIKPEIHRTLGVAVVNTPSPTVQAFADFLVDRLSAL